MCLSFVIARVPAYVSGYPSLRWPYKGQLLGLRTSRTRTGGSFDPPFVIRLREVIQRREQFRVEPPRVCVGSLLQTWAITAVRRPFDVSPGVGHGLHLAAREHRRLIGVIR